MTTCLDGSEIFKIILVGESGVGKTSIISQFVEHNFQESQGSTTGGTFSSKTVKCSNGKILNYEIWDTAGQEKYRSITTMFYKDSNAVILVYDITRADSFNELKTYWIEQVKEKADNVILGIAANKYDLIDNERVDEEDARNFAKEINAIFVTTSAKNSSGIDDLFIKIAKKYTGFDAELINDANSNELYEFRDIRKNSVRLNKNLHKNTKNKCC